MTKARMFALALLFSFAAGSAGLAAAQETTTPEQNAAKYKTPVLSDAEPAPAPDELPSGIVRRKGSVIVPLASISTPGKPVHTNYKIFVPAGGQISSAVTDDTFAETPASMGCVYGISTGYPGCKPSTGGTDHPNGGWGAIAVVDAYDYPQAASDLAFFDTHFGLPKANFKTVIANSSFGTLNGLTASCSGTPPPASDYGWDLEESLDTQWAHAMAPSANIIMVEACTQNLPDLLFAEEVAGIEVAKYGGGDISNSWGYPESYVGVSGDGGGTMTEQEDDNFFFRYYWSQITYFASAGDNGSEVLYPSASPWVVSAGGTTVNRDASGNFLSESCWSDSGGGPSTVELWQSPADISNGPGPWSDSQYQLFGGGAGVARVTPDISFNADPNSGVYVYNTDSYSGFVQVGGTSLSAPALAGIVNNAQQRLGMASTKTGGYYITSELNLMYANLDSHTAYPGYWYDVTTGSNGHAAGAGYDQCTGIGSPRGLKGK